MFGGSFGIGIRKAPPRKGETTMHLLDEDVINIVQLKEELNQPGNGIKMQYDVEDQKLIVCVFYSCVVATHPAMLHAIEQA